MSIEKEVNPPKIEVGNKSYTLNGMGYVFFTVSPIGKAFLANECVPGKKVIEIGSGYGIIPELALEAGVSEYIANDLSNEHLTILAQKITGKLPPEQTRNLVLMPGKAPQDLPDVSETFDAILADKIIHFMPPSDIEDFLRWAAKALKRNGKVYITASSPYSKLYLTVLPEYVKKHQAGAEYPGHFLDIRERHDPGILQIYPRYQVPNEMVLFSRRDLVDYLQKWGFEVNQSHSLKVPTEEEPNWQASEDEEASIAGAIATLRKNPNKA